MLMDLWYRLADALTQKLAIRHEQANALISMSTQPYRLHTQVGMHCTLSWLDGCCSSAVSLATQNTNLSTIRFPSVGNRLRPWKKGCEQHRVVQQGLVEPIRVNTFLVNERRWS